MGIDEGGGTLLLPAVCCAEAGGAGLKTGGVLVLYNTSISPVSIIKACELR